MQQKNEPTVTRDKAFRVLKDFNLHKIAGLDSDEKKSEFPLYKAQAIVSINSLFPKDRAKAGTLVQAVIIGDDNKTNKMVEIINNVIRSCHSLEKNTTFKNDEQKNQNLEASEKFQKNVIWKTHKFLKKESMPNAAEKKAFETTLINLTKTFLKDAPQISGRAIFSKVANFIVNKAAKIAGVESLSYPLAEALLNRSSAATKTTINVIQSALDHPDSKAATKEDRPKSAQSSPPELTIRFDGFKTAVKIFSSEKTKDETINPNEQRLNQKVNSDNHKKKIAAYAYKELFQEMAQDEATKSVARPADDSTEESALMKQTRVYRKHVRPEAPAEQTPKPKPGGNT